MISEARRMASATKANTTYDADNIKLHQGLDHVRIRPAMYIGDVYERGLHHLVYEVVDNSVDEAMAGFCTKIVVTIHDDDSITVLDNGRGIPVGMHKAAGKPAVEVCLTELGGGGKFEKGSYQVSGGLHGVGVSCVNALSEWLEVEVYREGRSHHMRFARGKTTNKLEDQGATDKRGTKITFKPDNEIFTKSTSYKFETLSKRLRELAYLNAGVKIILADERDEGRTEEYLFENGLVDFVGELCGSEAQLLRKPVYLKGSVESAESGGRVEVEVAIQYNDTYSDTMVSYANNIATIEGGTHLTGFRTAVTATLNAWFKDNESTVKFKTKKGKGSDARPTGDDYREGLVAVVSVKIPEPQFEGQTKTKLGNSDVAGIVQSVVGDYLRAWTEQNPGETKKIVQKAISARDARMAAKKAKELVRKTKDALRGGGLAKLTDCHSKKPEECEIYLVEGDSAGGTAVSAREVHTQAILPLRGKILNVWKATHEKMLGHSEISTIIQALGTGILDEFDLTKLQFHKIVIMCDADVDGSHIRTLLLTFFFRQMPELIKAGHVYVAQPPLFKITRGKSEEFLLTNEEREQRLRGLALDDSVLTVRGSDTQIKGEQLNQLITLLAEVARIGHEIEKKNIPFPKYLKRRRASDGLLPYAKVYYPGTKKAPPVFTEEELGELLRVAREDELKVWSSTDPLDERAGADVEVTRFPNKTRLERNLQILQEMGFASEQIFRPKATNQWEIEQLDQAGAPFALVRGKDEEPLMGLEDLPTAILALGEKGLKVQRYKGLGEMDADELKETTMDPANRQLLQITMEDMAGANSIFSTLMGSSVELRRDYIEQHAKAVENLDV
jgi:DNA gyrase subunit B